jgi:hypothetical protein
MLGRLLRNVCATAGVLIALNLLGSIAAAQTVTWGVNGAGGSGTWNTSNANWFNGSQNVTWPSGGNAVFAGATGGTVSSFIFGPVVSSMTFNTPGYIVQDGWIQSGTSGLTVTTNVDATINSFLTYSTSTASSLIKTGPATLSVGNEPDLKTVQVNQGELRLTGSSSLFLSDVNLANSPGVTVTLAQSTSASMGSLVGGGALGGVVHPSNQAQTMTLDIHGGGIFGGTLQDNGSGILAMEFDSKSSTQTLTNANTYSGATTVFGNLAFAGNGSATSTPISVYGSLSLDNSGTAVANRLSDSRTLVLDAGSLQLKGNNSTPVGEVVGPLSISGASNITITQPGSAATQLTSAGLQRHGHATLNIVGPGVSIEWHC